MHKYRIARRRKNGSDEESMIDFSPSFLNKRVIPRQISPLHGYPSPSSPKVKPKVDLTRSPLINLVSRFLGCLLESLSSVIYPEDRGVENNRNGSWPVPFESAIDRGDQASESGELLRT